VLSGYLLGKHFGAVWRLRAVIVQLPHGPLRRSLTRIHDLCWEEYGAYVGVGAVFASRPSFPHGPFGVFISGGARIGRDCVIFQHATIGSNTLPDSKGRGVPVLGDSCYLGAGATVVGGVVVGNNVRVGAGAVVTDDVPENSVVVCQPPRVIRAAHALTNRHYTGDAEGGWWYLREGRRIREMDDAVIRSLNSIAPNQDSV
jgi:serine O-acetyltransferase